MLQMDYLQADYKVLLYRMKRLRIGLRPGRSSRDSGEQYRGSQRVV
jgi:hypothetical protein